MNYELRDKERDRCITVLLLIGIQVVKSEIR